MGRMRETTRRRYEPPRVTVQMHSSSQPRPTIYGLGVIHTDNDSYLTPLCAKFRCLYIYSVSPVNAGRGYIYGYLES
ncbi:hypothetical protein ARMGADRAFT_475866 [Armillaria gallica]|uniref:Uncharacterized protein n=2 Tax=Armillaria gallica TaxID=47427 RepID=A0A2H3CVF6_ARMGA|nr:hypothetical protein ARMGADRAFT_475866 [Armillaria gallica]